MMSREEARQFVRKLLGDESLRERVEERLELEQSDPEVVDDEELRERLVRVVPEFAAEHGYDFTPEEGFEALEELRAEMESGELTDAELERVSGGDAKTKGELWAISFAGIGVGCAGYSIEEPGTGDLSCKFE